MVDHVWTKEQQHAAQQEGWDLFECDSTEHPPFELQAIGAPEDWNGLPYAEPVFVDAEGKVDDMSAWRYVVTKAAEGSELHISALAFLEFHSPEEWQHVTEMEAYT